MSIRLTEYTMFSARVGHNSPTISATRSRKTAQPKTKYCLCGVLQHLHILTEFQILFATTAYYSILAAFYPSTDHYSQTEINYSHD